MINQWRQRVSQFEGKIPKEYLEEFQTQQVSFVRKRVYLLCILTVVIYFLAILMGFALNPEHGSLVIEGIIGAFLISGSALVLYSNKRARTVAVSKFNGFMFTALLLIILIKLDSTHPNDVLLTSSAFVFTLFLVSTIIPWTSSEVLGIGALHVIGYTLSIIYLGHTESSSGIIAASFRTQEHMEGYIFIALAIVLCAVMRREETKRDIQNFVLFQEVEKKNDQMRKELEWATRIHKTIIPKSIITDKLDMAVKYLPVYYIGGDYVKFEFLDEDHVIFIITDVTGHGVPAALLVNRVHAEFERMAKEGKHPGPLLKELNSFIIEDFEGSGMYLSAFCGLLDLKNMKLSYSNYGHPPQYIYDADKSCVNGLSAGAGLLGLPLDNNTVHEDHIDIDENDKILLFTDGIIEAADNTGEEYGFGRLKEFLEKQHSVPSEEFNRKLLEDVDLFKDGKFKDDVCLLCISIKCHRSLLSLGGKLFKHNADT